MKKRLVVRSMLVSRLEIGLYNRSFKKWKELLWSEGAKQKLYLTIYGCSLGFEVAFFKSNNKVVIYKGSM